MFLCAAMLTMLAALSSTAAPGSKRELGSNAASSLTDALSRRKVSTQPLQPIGEPTPQENQELQQALDRFAKRSSRDDFNAITDFLDTTPHSAWRASLLAELGEEYYKTGHFSKALQAWERAWQERPVRQGQEPLALPCQQAAASLANLYARLGRMEPLRVLLGQLQAVPLMGYYAKQIEDARFGLTTMDQHPEIAFRCGPLALDRLRSWQHPTNACHPLIFNSKSTTNGICLKEVAQLAHQLGMDYQIAFRSPGAKLIVPAVIHWRVGHYAAVVREAHELFLTQDPTFWNDTWASAATLDDEASGYFLVPAGPLPAGWRAVGEAEAGSVWGKGTTREADPDATSDRDDKLNDNQCHGMATWDFNLMLVNQRISDTPIGYRPPIGPPIYFTFTMSAQDNWMRQFASWWGTTLGENWSCNWNSFVQDDPSNPSGNLRVYDQGGWLTFIEDPTQTGVFRCEFRNPGYFTILTTNNINLGYIWNLPDGSKKIYGHAYSQASSTTQFSLLTAVVDPAGNAATIEYDDNFPGRITAIVDALGQRTTLEYGLTDPGYPPPQPISQGNVQFNWQVTKITDPFGRSAQFQYQIVKDGSPPAYLYYVTNLIDVVGMSSQLTFFPGWAISSWPIMPDLTTPYGTTHFQPFVIANRNFGVEITDPNGDKERLQYCENNNVGVDPSELQQNVPRGLTYAENAWLYARNVFYWDKKAYAEGFSQNTNDYTKAVIYHFTHAQNLNASGPILESIKRPLENRVWFNYPGQGAGWFPGTDDHPSMIGRVLDDATTQLSQFAYNSYGNLTNSIDPVGRTFSFIYDTNEIDLLEVRQTRQGQNELVLKASYNNQHRPVTLTDAAGQTTVYTYNGRGQVLTAINPKNETNTFEYNSKGYLTAIDGPLPGAQDRDTFTYDAAGRLQTATDQDGYAVTLEYDDLDRLTKATFPDGTYQQITYDRLKPGTFRDRLGRVTSFTYTALAQLESIQDPLGRLTRFQWCRCGELEAIVDPLGRMTSWLRDIEGRVTAKRYADGSLVRYDYEHTTGRLRETRDEQNQVTQFDYYNDNALKRKTFLNAVNPTPSVQFTYDPNYPRVSTMQDGEGTTTYAYYPITAAPALGAGQLASIDGPWPNDTIAYTYDELGRAISRGINGVALRRDFDTADRLSRLTNMLGAFNFAWEGGSRRISSVKYPNGQHTDYAYYQNSGDQLLRSITNYLPDNSVLSQFSYQYNSRRQLTDWIQTQGNTSQDWQPAYDLADRLVGVSVSSGGTSGGPYTYNYDGANNTTLLQEGPLPRQFQENALNELTAATNSALPGMAFAWDAANRLAAISNGTHRTEFHYDGYDRWTHIVETDNGSPISDRRYLWCGLQLCEERDATGGTVLKRFSTFGISSQGAPDLPSGSYFFTHDHLGSIREITDAAGVVQGQFAYTPYGQRQLLSGSLEPGFGFTGHFQHQPSSLLLAPFRAYSPQLGRWLNRDPGQEAGGLNLYAYAANDPLNNVDPTGFGVKPGAVQLAQDLEPVQQLKQGTDAYDKAKDYGKKLDTVMEKGLKKAAEEEAEHQGEEAMKDLTKNPAKDYEETLKQAQKTGKEGVDPLSQAVHSVYDPALDQMNGKNCDKAKEPAPTRKTMKSYEAAPEPSVLDKIIQFITSPFSGSPESSPASAPTTTGLSPLPQNPPPGAWENGTGYR